MPRRARRSAHDQNRDENVVLHSADKQHLHRENRAGQRRAEHGAEAGGDARHEEHALVDGGDA